MLDLTIQTDQTVAMPEAPYVARHFIDGQYHDSADGLSLIHISEPTRPY